MEARRQTDYDHTEEIERMIASESDPRIRVQLMMMHKLTTAVSDIGANVNDLDKKFSMHSDGESALINQVKGAWRVAAWVFGIAQLIIAYVYIDINSQVKTLSVQQQKDQLEHVSINADIAQIRQFIGGSK